MNIADHLRSLILWTLELLHDLVDCFVAVFSKRARIKRKLHHWVRRNCPPCSATDQQPVAARLVHLLQSDCWVDGSLIRLVGQSLDPEPHVEAGWPEADWHVGQSAILRRLHIRPVFTKSDITSHKFSPRHIEDTLIEYLTRVRNKIEQNRSLYTLYEREKQDLTNYENLSELEISLDFKAANQMDGSSPQGEAAQFLAPVQTRATQEAQLRRGGHKEVPMTVNQQRAQDFVARGTGLMYGKTGQKNTFYIYCKDLATELNNIVIEINNRVAYNYVNINSQLVDTELFHERNLNNDIVIQYRSNNEYVKVSYVCTREGKYEIRVTYYGYNIPGSPFLLNIEHAKEPEEIQIKTSRPSLDHASDETSEWVDLPGKRKSIKRSMSTLPSLCRLRKQKFLEETIENEPELLAEDCEVAPTDEYSLDSRTLKKENSLVKSDEEELRHAQDKIILQRSVSKFYEYESTESNATERSDKILKTKNINPILTLFESFDLQQKTQRKGRQRRRNLTYSNSNMKRYSKLIINNQDLFQIVSHLDFVIKSLNTNELLDILSDVRNKLELIEKYDKDIQSLRKQKCDEKKFHGDQISLISEYFTLMHVQLSRKFDSIAKLISDNIEEIDIELQQDERNELESDNHEMRKSELIPQVKMDTFEIQSPEQQEDTTCHSDVAQDSDILRAKRAREKFQKRGNSKKRYDQQKSSSSESTTKEDRLQTSSFTEINLSPSTTELLNQSEHEMSKISDKTVPIKTVRQNSQLTFHKSLTISVEFSDHEISLEPQNQFSELDMPHTYSVDMQNSLTKQTERNEENCQENSIERKNSREHLVNSKTQSLDVSKELIFNESQSELKPLKFVSEDAVREKLNNITALENSQSYKEKTPDEEREENVRDNYCIQSKKFSGKEKVEQRQTNLHIKETNFHCAANLNKNNLKIYDNEDKNERKEDYFRFYALNSEDNIDCDNGLNYSQITNVRDLNNSQQREEKYEITTEQKLQSKCGKAECEKNIENLEQKEEDVFKKKNCFVSDNNDVPSVHDKNEEEMNHIQSKETNLSNEILDLKEAVGLKANQHKELSIKISKNDLYSGKVLTVDCPKENVGSTIQMKIELCKCSCVETISTQTEDTKIIDNAGMQDEQIQDERQLIETKDPCKEQKIRNYEIKEEQTLAENVSENHIAQENIFLINEKFDTVKDEKQEHRTFHDQKYEKEEENLTDVKVNNRDDLSALNKQNEEQSEQKLVHSVFGSHRHKLEEEKITRGNVSNNQFSFQESNTSLKVNKREVRTEQNENINEQNLEIGALKDQKHTFENNKQVTDIAKNSSLENIEPIETKITKFNKEPLWCDRKSTTVNFKAQNTVPKQTHGIFHSIEVYESKVSPTESEIPRGLVNQLIGKYEKPAAKAQKPNSNEENKREGVSTMDGEDFIKDFKVKHDMVSSIQSKCSSEENKTRNHVPPDIILPHEKHPEPNQKCSKTLTNTRNTEFKIPYVVDTSEVITIQNYHNVYINDNSEDFKLSYSSSTDFESLENMYVLIDNQGTNKSLNPSKVESFDSSKRNDYKMIQTMNKFDVDLKVDDNETHEVYENQELKCFLTRDVTVKESSNDVFTEKYKGTVAQLDTKVKMEKENNIECGTGGKYILAEAKNKELTTEIVEKSTDSLENATETMIFKKENQYKNITREENINVIHTNSDYEDITHEMKEEKTTENESAEREIKKKENQETIKDFTETGSKKTKSVTDNTVAVTKSENKENITKAKYVDTTTQKKIQDIVLEQEKDEINNVKVEHKEIDIEKLAVNAKNTELPVQSINTTVVEEVKESIYLRDKKIEEDTTKLPIERKDKKITTQTETRKDEKIKKLPIKFEDKDNTAETVSSIDEERKKLPINKEIKIKVQTETSIDEGVKESSIKIEDNEIIAQMETTISKGELPKKVGDENNSAEEFTKIDGEVKQPIKIDFKEIAQTETTIDQRQLPIKMEEEINAEVLTTTVEQLRELPIKNKDKEITVLEESTFAEVVKTLSIKIEEKDITTEEVSTIVDHVKEVPIEIEDKENTFEAVSTVDKEVQELPIKIEDMKIITEEITTLDERIKEPSIEIEEKEITAEAVNTIVEQVMELPIKIEDKETTTEAISTIDEGVQELPIKIEEEVNAEVLTTTVEQLRELPIKNKDKEITVLEESTIAEVVKTLSIKIEEKDITTEEVSTIFEHAKEVTIEIEDKENTSEAVSTVDKEVQELPIKIEENEIITEETATLDERIKEPSIKIEEKEITAEAVNTIVEQVMELPIKIEDKEITTEAISTINEGVQELPIKIGYKNITTEEVSTIVEQIMEIPIEIEDKDITLEAVSTIDKEVQELPIKIEENEIITEEVTTLDARVKEPYIKIEEKEITAKALNTIVKQVMELPIKIEDKDITTEAIPTINEGVQELPIKIGYKNITTEEVSTIVEQIMEIPIEIEYKEITLEAVSTIDKEVQELPIKIEDREIITEEVTTLNARVKEPYIKIEEKDITVLKEFTISEEVKEQHIKIEDKIITEEVTTLDEKIKEPFIEKEEKEISAEAVITIVEQVMELPINIDVKEITAEVVSTIDKEVQELPIKIEDKEIITEEVTTINEGVQELLMKLEGKEITTEKITKPDGIAEKITQIKGLPIKMESKEISAEEVTKIDEEIVELNIKDKENTSEELTPIEEVEEMKMTTETKTTTDERELHIQIEEKEITGKAVTTIDEGVMELPLKIKDKEITVLMETTIVAEVKELSIKIEDKEITDQTKDMGITDQTKTTIREGDLPNKRVEQDITAQAITSIDEEVKISGIKIEEKEITAEAVFTDESFQGLTMKLEDKKITTEKITTIDEKVKESSIKIEDEDITAKAVSPIDEGRQELPIQIEDKEITSKAVNTIIKQVKELPINTDNKEITSQILTTIYEGEQLINIKEKEINTEVVTTVYERVQELPIKIVLPKEITAPIESTIGEGEKLIKIEDNEITAQTKTTINEKVQELPIKIGDMEITAQTKNMMDAGEQRTKLEDKEITTEAVSTVDGRVQELPIRIKDKEITAEALSTIDEGRQQLTIIIDNEITAEAIASKDQEFKKLPIKKENIEITVEEELDTEFVKELYVPIQIEKIVSQSENFKEFLVAEKYEKTIQTKSIEEEIKNTAQTDRKNITISEMKELAIEEKHKEITDQVVTEENITDEEVNSIHTKVEDKMNTFELQNKKTPYEEEIKELPIETKENNIKVQLEAKEGRTEKENKELNTEIEFMDNNDEAKNDNNTIEEEVKKITIERQGKETNIQVENKANATAEKFQELPTEVDEKDLTLKEKTKIAEIKETEINLKIETKGSTTTKEEKIEKLSTEAENNNTSYVENLNELIIETKDKGIILQIKNKENTTVEETKGLHTPEKNEEKTAQVEIGKTIIEGEVEELTSETKDEAITIQVESKENRTEEGMKVLPTRAEVKGHTVKLQNKNTKIEEEVGEYMIETKDKDITVQVESKDNIAEEENKVLPNEVEDKGVPIHETTEDKNIEEDKKNTVELKTVNTAGEEVNELTIEEIDEEITVKAIINNTTSKEKVEKMTVQTENEDIKHEKQGQEIISETQQSNNTSEIETKHTTTEDIVHVHIPTIGVETNTTTTKELSQIKHELPDLTKTKKLTVIKSDLEDRPVSPSTCPTKRMKCPKFIIRKTYFEHLANTDKIDTTCKKSSKHTKEEFEGDTVKNKRDIFSKLSCGVKELDTISTSLVIDSVSTKIKDPHFLMNISGKSIESLEPSVQIKRTIFENKNRDIQEKESTSKLNCHDSLESIAEVVKINKSIFEKEDKDIEESGTSKIPNQCNEQDYLEIKTDTVKSKKTVFEHEIQNAEIGKREIIKRHESLASLEAAVKNKKTIFEKNNQVNGDHIKSTVNIPNIFHDSLGVVEQSTKNNNIVIKHETIPKTLQDFEDKPKEKLGRHDSLDTIEKTFKTKKTIFEKFDRAIKSETILKETPCDSCDSRDNLGKINKERKNIVENENQCVEAKLEKHKSLETLQEIVKKKRTIFENDCQETVSLKKEQSNIARDHDDVSVQPIKEIVKNKKTIFENNIRDVELKPLGKFVDLFKRFDIPEGTEPLVAAVENIDEEIVLVDNDKSRPISTHFSLGKELEMHEKNIVSLKSKFNPVEDKHSSCNNEKPIFIETNNKTDIEFPMNSGNINLKKAIFEKEFLSPLQEMKVTHDSLDYIEPIVTSIKNEFEIKSRGSHGKGIGSVENFESEESHVPDYLCNEENNPEKQVLSSRRRNLCETNRLTETYVNSMRLSEAIESKVNSERDTGIETEGNVSHVQTNDENCINSKSICNTRILQGVKEAPNTGFNRMSEIAVKRESDSLKVEFDRCSESQIENSSVNLRSSGMNSESELSSSIDNTKDHKTKMECSLEKVQSIFMSHISSPFFDSQDNTEEFLTWASNEEFSKPDVENEPISLNFQRCVTNLLPLNNLISTEDGDIASNNLSETVSHALESLEVEDSPGNQENLSSKVSFQLGSSDDESNLHSEKICADESNESSLDYDSIIQAPSLDEALEKLDLKLKKEVIKDFKNDTEKLELFNKNKSIQGVTDTAGKLKFCFNVTDEEGISNSKWEDSMFSLKTERESVHSTSPVISFPDEPTTSPMKSPNIFIQSSKNMASESKHHRGFNIIELKEPTDILLMGPAEKEIVWGITDEEAVKIFQQSCADGSETHQTGLTRKSPEPGKLHHHQPGRSPSPLASFLNSSLGTIDETQEYFYTSVDNADDVATVRLIHTHSLIYRSDSETSVKEEELDLKKMPTFNPSIHITNYDVENFLDNDKKTLQWNNEKIIEAILEDALLRPRSNNQNYENDPIVLENNEAIEKNKVNDDTDDHGLGDASNAVIQDMDKANKCEEPVRDVIDRIIIDSLDCKTKNIDICGNENKEHVHFVDIMREDDEKRLRHKDEFDFECKPEFVQKWKNYWDERFSQNKEMQESLNRSLSDEAEKILQRQGSPCSEANENFVSKQRRIFENEICLETKKQTESNVIVSDNNSKTNSKKSHENDKEDKIVDEKVQSVKLGDFRSDTMPVKAEVPYQHVTDFSYFFNNLRQVNVPRKPSIKVKDIVKKQKQKFESLFRSSFKSKKLKIPKQEYFKEAKNSSFSIPLGSPRKENRRKAVDTARNEIPSIFNEPIWNPPCGTRTSVSPLFEPLDKEDSLSATFKIMKDVNMIPQNQTYDEWRQSYCQQKTKHMDTSKQIEQTFESQHEQNLDKKLDSDEEDVKTGNTQKDDKDDVKTGNTQKDDKDDVKTGTTQKDDKDDVKTGTTQKDDKDDVKTGTTQKDDKNDVKTGNTQKDEKDDVKTGNTQKDEKDDVKTGNTQKDEKDDVKTGNTQKDDKDDVKTGNTQKDDKDDVKTGTTQKDEKDDVKTGNTQKDDKDDVKTGNTQKDEKDDVKTGTTQKDDFFDNSTNKSIVNSQKTQVCYERAEKTPQDCELINDIPDIEKVVPKEIDTHLSFTSEGDKSETNSGQVESIEVPVEDTRCRESNQFDSEFTSDAKEYEKVTNPDNQEPSHSNIKVTADEMNLLDTSSTEVEADLSSPDGQPDGLKYSPEYPYLPKTPLDEYQHRSDLYKELITRKQLFKLTQFVKK